MLDRLRALRDRPIGDSERPALFAVAMAVLVAGAVLFGLIDRPEGEEPQPAPVETVAEAPAPADEEPSAAQTPPNSGELPIPEGEATDRDAAAPSEREIAAARRTVSGFLAGYLPYTYGKREAREVPLVTGELRAALEQSAPRVPPGASRGGAPQVETLQVDASEEDALAFLALVDDGVRSYTVEVGVALGDQGWRVTGVGG